MGIYNTWKDTFGAHELSTILSDWIAHFLINLCVYIWLIDVEVTMDIIPGSVPILGHVCESTQMTNTEYTSWPSALKQQPGKF